MAIYRVDGADLEGTTHRVTLNPELIRRAARLGGYSDPGNPNVVELSDIIELAVMANLSDFESEAKRARGEYYRTNELPQRLVCGDSQEARQDFSAEAALARKVLHALLRPDVLTRQSVHNQLPDDCNVIAIRMGPPRGTVTIPGGIGRAIMAASVNDYGEAFRRRRGVETKPRGIADRFSDEEFARTVLPRDAWPKMEPQDIRGGYKRYETGMSLSDSVEQVWGAARGYWAISPVANYVVPSRFGYCPYVFKVAEGDDGWNPVEPESRAGRYRYWAKLSWYIDPVEECLYEMTLGDASTNYLPVRKRSPIEPTETDLAVARVLTGKCVVLGRISTNPVLRLRQKGRVLV